MMWRMDSSEFIGNQLHTGINSDNDSNLKSFEFELWFGLCTTNRDENWSSAPHIALYLGPVSTFATRKVFT